MLVASNDYAIYLSLPALTSAVTINQIYESQKCTD